MQKIIILGFGSPAVHVFNYDPELWEDAEDFVNDAYEKGLILNGSGNCNWMVVDELEIQIH